MGSTRNPGLVDTCPTNKFHFFTLRFSMHSYRLPQQSGIKTIPKTCRTNKFDELFFFKTPPKTASLIPLPLLIPQMITHLLRTHLFMEPIAVASWRQLPSLHPLWKLLTPHLRGVFAINTVGREKLIPAGGMADHTLSVGGGGKNAYIESPALCCSVPCLSRPPP